MASAIHSTQQHAYGYPQPPPSPPMDETAKCSLPSISNLLVMAGAGSPTTEKPPQAHSFSETRPNSSHYSSNGPPRTALPPTPPMSSDASFDGHNSPSTRSATSYYETTPPVEDVQRHYHAGQRGPQNAPSYAQPPFAPTSSSHMGQPPAVASYYSPAPPSQPLAPGNLKYQKPLPQNFQLPVQVTVAPSSGSNPWQHHHYISPSSAACFPQSQDRYICQICNKAFSRPSSLRIHSHSHTGEKPFKCPHVGCGKAFSVRSNMKRHERGCHNYDSGATGMH